MIIPEEDDHEAVVVMPKLYKIKRFFIVEKNNL